MRILSPARRDVFAQYSGSSEPSYIQYWEFIQAYLKASNANKCSQEDLFSAMAVLSHEMVLSSYMDIIRTTFTKKIIPTLAQVVPSSDTFVPVAQNLSEGLRRYEKCFSRLHQNYEGISAGFQALVCSELNTEPWKSAISSWLRDAIRSKSGDAIEKIYALTIHIGIDHIFRQEVQLALVEYLRESVRSKHVGIWDERRLAMVVSEMSEKSSRLLAAVFHPGGHQGHFDSMARAILADLRSEEMFDIIVDFPASNPALEDLRSCMNSLESRSDLVSRFSSQCRARLLHPGANTPDIITVYIATIRAFLILDPPGVLLDKVARPIRAYLRERSDTIRCIITSLLGEVDNDLATELSTQVNIEEINDEDDPDWEPDPVDAAPDYAKSRASDIIGSLISIYENREIFVKELQNLLSDRLLAVLDYNIDQELRNVEMLKVRFGDSLLGVCDVMLKDMSDSRRIDSAIHEKKEPPNVPPAQAYSDNLVHATIISRLYWPGTKSTIYAEPDDPDDRSNDLGLKLPEHILHMFSEYSREFSKLKAQRSLLFQKDLGHVRVELELQDRTFDMMVTPAHAAAISLFDSRATRSLLEICTLLNISEQETRRALAFWLRQGILSLSGDVYTVQEHSAEATISEQAEIEEVVTDVADDIDEMSTYWNFIVGMLTNVGSLEMDRIQSMLGMFAPSYDKTVDQLQHYLQKRTRDGDVEVKGGLYKLP